MTDKYVLSLDQGTTSTRAILFDKNGNTVRKSQKELTQYFPSSGWVEHDPEEIFACATEVVRDVMEKANVSATDVCAMGITNQRETVIVWEKDSGKPIYNAIVWQCRRTSSLMEELKLCGKLEYVYSKTGLTLDAYFSASKIKWILDNVPLAREKALNGELLAGTVDSYLLYRLTGGKVHATDCTNASRTLLYNIHTLSWDDELCELFTVPKSILPTVYPSGYYYGDTEAELFDGPIKICALVGDQQSALFGQLCWEKGDAKNTYGTGCFLLSNTGDKPLTSNHGLLTTVCATLDGEKAQYALEGSVFIAGAGIQWLRDGLGLISSSAESETLALSVKDSGGVVVVPAFVGLGAPYWDSDATGLITGITRATTRAHVVRATLESIAMQTYDVLCAMENDLGEKITALKVDGGASANRFLMQFQSDVLDAKIIRPAEVETTALGASFLAGLTCGYWKDRNELRKQVSSGSKTFTPTISTDKRASIISNWQRAIQKTLKN